eukprot:765966-Hanusia_phi.AAC.17
MASMHPTSELKPATRNHVLSPCSEVCTYLAVLADFAWQCTPSLRSTSLKIYFIHSFTTNTLRINHDHRFAVSMEHLLHSIRRSSTSDFRLASRPILLTHPHKCLISQTVDISYFPSEGLWDMARQDEAGRAKVEARDAETGMGRWVCKEKIRERR